MLDTKTRILVLIAFEFLILFFQSSTYAQDSIVLSGKVRNSITKEPISYAHLFFNKTKCGTYSDSDGSFEISCEEPSSELFVSHVGYTAKSMFFTKDTSEDNVTIFLDPFTNELDEIVVSVMREKNRKQNMRFFEREFLGRSESARKCTIDNPDVISFNEKGDILIASADEPIVVYNYATGYRIQFYLSHFEFNKKTLLPKYSGHYLIEEMDTLNFAVKKKWEKRRKENYQGSLEHFVATLTNQSSNANGYIISNLDSAMLQILPKEDGKTILKVAQDIDVTYTKEVEPISYRMWIRRTSKQFRGNEQVPLKTDHPQTTTISPENGLIILNSDGQILNQESITLHGYMGWERVSELLPFNYIKRNK